MYLRIFKLHSVLFLIINAFTVWAFHDLHIILMVYPLKREIQNYLLIIIYIFLEHKCLFLNLCLKSENCLIFLTVVLLFTSIKKTHTHTIMFSINYNQ